MEKGLGLEFKTPNQDMAQGAVADGPELHSTCELQGQEKLP